MTNHLILIGLPDWVADQPHAADQRILTVGAPLLGWRFAPVQVIIQPNLRELASETELERIRHWVTLLQHKFGPRDAKAAHQMFATHGLLEEVAHG